MKYILAMNVSGSECDGLERNTDHNNISLAEAQGAFYLLGLGEKCYSICWFINP